jgi:hypothetical protein
MSLDDDRIEANKNEVGDKQTHNASGRQIAPNTDGHKAFWDWMGKSVVVSKDGKPLVLFHGRFGDFDEFELGIAGGNGVLDGFFFADETSLEYAEGYLDSQGREGANFVPAYLALENPLLVIASEEDSGGEYEWLNPDYEQDQIKRAREFGHDGLIIQSEYGERFYIAFHPGQIKSAVGNNGLYRRDDPSITDGQALRVVSKPVDATDSAGDVSTKRRSLRP